MRLRQLEAFRQVMRAGSVTRAAESLGISQPGVSRLLTDLEKHLGLKLFERRRRRVIPTPEAERFFHVVEQCFVGLDALDSAAAEIAGSQGAELKIAVFPAVALKVMPAVLARLRPEFPRTFCSLHITNSSRVLDLVSTKQVDIGFSAMAPRHPGVETAGHVGLECVCALPQTHRLARKRGLVPRDLKGEKLVVLDASSSSHAAVRKMLVESGIAGEVACEVSASQAACELVRLGLGIAIVDPLTAAAFPGGSLAFRALKPGVPFNVYTAAPAHKVGSRVSQRLVELFNDLVR